MEVSGVTFRRVPCLSGAVIETHFENTKPCRATMRVRPPRKFSMVMNSGFCDNRHTRYYHEGTGLRCVGLEKKEEEEEEEKKKKKKEKNGSDELTPKKKLKLLESLTRDLSKFSDIGFGLDSDNDLLHQVQGKVLSDAADVLMKQLQHLRAEEEELKRKRKEEKAKHKATQMNRMVDCESSSSESSESSDSECEDVIDMSSLRSEPLAQTAEPVVYVQSLSQKTATTLTIPSTLTQEGNTTEANGLGDHRLDINGVECCTRTSTSFSSRSVASHNESSSSVTVPSSAKRIEVCMGKKCGKSGGPALLEEFERVVGVEGAVVGCKCLGKCKDGPNVRVLNSVDGRHAEGVDVSVRTPTNPLFIGVGLDDVGVIVANFLGDEQKDLGLAAAV